MANEQQNHNEEIKDLLTQLVNAEKKENVQDAKVNKLSTIKNWVWIAIALGGVLIPSTAWFIHLKDAPSRITHIEQTYIKERLNERLTILEEKHKENDIQVSDQLETLNEEVRELNVTDDRLEGKIDLLICHDIDGRPVQECISVVNYNNR